MSETRAFRSRIRVPFATRLHVPSSLWALREAWTVWSRTRTRLASNYASCSETTGYITCVNNVQ